MIKAAGAVLWRHGLNGVEVAVIARPKYRDGRVGGPEWSLPKGKLHEGENLLGAALREVEEETGQRARPGAYLGETRYRVGGEDKVVAYWAMEALGGSFAAGDEVDEVRWLPPEQAAQLLTHERDREVLRRFAVA